MATPRPFVRARRPEEIAVRRAAILRAARALIHEVGATDFSLSELARRSGVSKPNLYRYFESLEEVLLQVWIEEVRAFKEGLAAAFARTRRHDVATTVRIIVTGFVARPLLGELTALAAPLVERNLSVEAIVTAKLTLVELIGDVAALLHARLPKLLLADCAWAASAIATHVAGLWPGAHPGPVARRAFERPEISALCPSFERDFARFLEVLFAGLLARR